MTDEATDPEDADAGCADDVTEEDLAEIEDAPDGYGQLERDTARDRHLGVLRVSTEWEGADDLDLDEGAW